MFMTAQDAHRKASEIRDAREQKNLTDAIIFLEEYRFNERVMEACEKEQFMLPAFITIDDTHIAQAVLKILKDYGYSTRMQLRGAKYQIAVSWSNPEKKEEDSLDY